MKSGQFIRGMGRTIISIPKTYSAILFSENAWLGLILIGMSMFSPLIGLAGIAGVVTAVLFSRLIGYENWESASGLLSFNSLLIAWAVAYYYPLTRFIHQPWELPVIVGVAAILGQMLSVILSQWTQNAFKMPSMSLSFSIVALLLWYYFARTGMLVADLAGKPLLFDWNVSVSPFWHQYFVSLGSIFFSPHVVTGMVVAVVLLLLSRLGFGLTVLGWTLCYHLSRLWGAGSGNGMYYPGFNVILTVMVVGGVFLLPGKTAWVIGLVAGVFAFLLSVAGNSMFHYYDNLHQTYTALQVPVFALPFNVVVFLTVYAMRLRLKAVSPVVNDTGIFHPEGALEHYLSHLKRFTRLGIPQFSLPLTGEWIVTQGHQGKHTHKLDWAYAWDFEMEDKRGQNYAERADQLSDYYAFSKPVWASAAGYVSKVVNHIPDNAPGNVNAQENWGNFISISHGYGLWSLYAHLKRDSITVKPGDYVNCGEKIGLVGNSGRSFVPHLHFQVQLGAEAGSRSKLCHLINYKVKKHNNAYQFIGSGIPKEGDRVSSLISAKDPAQLLGLHAQGLMQFAVTKGSGNSVETWKSELDFWGRMHLRSSDGTSLEYSVYNGIYNALGLRGRKINALSAFALILSRLPYSEHNDLVWQDTPSISVVCNPVVKNLVLLLTPIVNPLKVTTSSGLTAARKTNAVNATDEVVHIHSTTEYRLFGILINKHSGEIELDTGKGIRSIKLYKGKRLLVIATSTANK